MKYEKKHKNTKLFVSKRSTNFVSHSFQKYIYFSFQFQKNTIKIQELNFLDKIYEIHKKRLDEKLFA